MFIDYCIELNVVDNNLCKNFSHFVISYLMISALFLWGTGNVLFRVELQIDANMSTYEHFESTFYMKSMSMPLIEN